MPYLLQWKAFLKLFIKLFDFTGKSSANNSKRYRKLTQEDSERRIINIFLIAAAACHESGFWRVTFQQDCRSTQNAFL